MVKATGRDRLSKILNFLSDRRMPIIAERHRETSRVEVAEMAGSL